MIDGENDLDKTGAESEDSNVEPAEDSESVEPSSETSAQQEQAEEERVNAFTTRLRQLGKRRSAEAGDGSAEGQTNAGLSSAERTPPAHADSTGELPAQDDTIGSEETARSTIEKGEVKSQQLSARERLEARRAEAFERQRQEKIRSGIERVDGELAEGKHKTTIAPRDLEWLAEDPRHQELAYDVDVGTYRVSEARSAIAAEEQGVLPAPVRRSIESGADVDDGEGQPWQIKGTGRDSTLDGTTRLISAEAQQDRRCLADLRQLTLEESAHVHSDLVRELAGRRHGEVRFLPPSLKPIESERVPDE